jgi:AbrB family looped-hinge helix DNA binding protein
MPIVKIRTNRQVTIPKRIFDEAGFQEGGFVEVTRNRDRVVIRSKKSVDRDDILTPEEEELVRRGEAQLRRRESALWEDVKKKLRL